MNHLYSACSAGLVTLFDALQFDDAANRHPLLDIEIALTIPADPVGRDELTIEPVRRWQFVGRPLLWIDIVTEVRDEAIVLIENRQPPGEVANDNIGSTL